MGLGLESTRELTKSRHGAQHRGKALLGGTGAAGGGRRVQPSVCLSVCLSRGRLWAGLGEQPRISYRRTLCAPAPFIPALQRAGHLVRGGVRGAGI